MNTFSPKQLFIDAEKENAQLLRENAPRPWFKSAMVHGLAQMNMSGSNTDEMRGAVYLVRVLMNLAEAETEIPKLPQIRLETFDENPAKPKK